MASKNSAFRKTIQTEAKAKREAKEAARIGERWIGSIDDLGKAFKAASSEAFSKEALKALKAVEAGDDVKAQLGAWLPILALLSIVKRAGKDRHAFSFASLTDAIVNASEGRIRKAHLDSALEEFFSKEGKIQELGKTKFWSPKKIK